MINKTILHYKIIEKLGEGGMGVVYKAEDTKLKRAVAIKFLPRHIAASEEERQRFKIEAQASAALNHPNIATIHAIEEVDDEMFIVMEYIEGRELREIIANLAKVSNLRKVLKYATQIAEGLQAAHEKGITHRDIKSTNIMVTDSGQIKIMDFGLAKIGGGTQLTKDHSTLGTAAYMSPEQTRGEVVDHRSDIWSFGVVFYEMLTGKLPFPGDYEQVVIYSILNEEPEMIADLRQDVPEKLQQIVHRMLAKKLQERSQNARDILEDLKGISEQKVDPHKSTSPKTKYVFAIFGSLVVLSVFAFFFINPQKNNSGTSAGNPVAKMQRVAVLPFTNIRKDPETDFLGFALADQIIGSLSYLENILVRPSSAIRKYEKEIIEISSAGSDLRVDYILTGNYLKQEDLVRLNVELVTVNSSELLWRELIEVKYENAFTLQDIVSERIVNGLKLQFAPDERLGIHEDTPQNPLAYEYYLRGVAFPSSNKENQLAVNILQKAIELDSSYAPAFSELGFRLKQLAMYIPGNSKQSKRAEMAYLKALSLNSKLISALGGLAAHYTETGQIEKSVALLRRSLEINPTNADGHFYLGYAYRYAGFLEKAKEQMEIALALDPQNRRFRSIGVTYMYLGNYKKALQGFELDNGGVYCFGFSGQVYMRMNQPEKALEYFNRVLELEQDSDFSRWVDEMKAYIEGDFEKGISVARRHEQADYADGEQWYHSANLYGLLGDEEGCIRLLKKAVEGGFFCYPFMLSDPFLDSVRDSPDFQIIIEKARGKHESFGEKFFPDNL